MTDNLVSKAVEMYKKSNLPHPDIYQAGVQDGLRLAVQFLLVCAGLPNEFGITTAPAESPSELAKP